MGQKIFTLAGANHAEIRRFMDQVASGQDVFVSQEVHVLEDKIPIEELIRQHGDLVREAINLRRDENAKKE